MTPDQRTKLLRWLYLLGPALSLLLVSPISLVGIGPQLKNSIPPVVYNAAFTAFKFAPLGWLLLLLGCSAGTCLGMLRRRGMAGAVLIIYMILGTTLIAAAHVFVICSVAFAGCMVATGGKALGH